MEISNYAPVIIPTLNRFTHFKRCLDSLERCTGAEKTDVYVGLDYPPSEKYVEGWKQIDAYLEKKEKNNGFKNLFVRRRDHNCGLEKEGSNYALLVEEVKDYYDSYIFSEDDNEFSRNFLEYMNYGLTKYSDNKSVMSICGYLFPDVVCEHDNETFLAPFTSAWGVGFWKDHQYNYIVKGDKAFVEDILSSWERSWKLFRLRATSLDGFLTMHFKCHYFGDVLKTAEMLLDGTTSLFPTISKVRNWGHDGSGIHCGHSNKYITQEIDERIRFYSDLEAPVLNIAHNIDYSFAMRIVVLIRYICFRITGKDSYAFYKKCKQIWQK